VTELEDLEPEAAQLLSRARRGLSPAADDRARVLAAIGPLVAAQTGVPATPSSGSKLPAWARIGGVLLALGAAVTAGYGWGYRAGLAKGAPPPVVGPVRAAVSVTTHSDAPASAPEEQRSEVARESQRSDSAKATAARVRAASAARPAASAPIFGLDEEVRQLRRVERAIRDGNPRLALAIVDNLDRDVPRGQLLHERRAARLMASCQLDVATSAAAAASFVAQNPSSAYAPRLRELCELATERPGAGD
jgi:hypothetical protein